MDWFDVTTIDGERKLINANAIMSVTYYENTDLTVIDFTRAAYPGIAVKGDAMKDIRKQLVAHEHYVSKVGA